MLAIVLFDLRMTSKSAAILYWCLKHFLASQELAEAKISPTPLFMGGTCLRAVIILCRTQSQGRVRNRQSMAGATQILSTGSSVSMIEAMASPAKSGSTDASDFVQQISQSRVYQDYERAFGKTTNLPLQLSKINICSDAHRAPSNYANPFCMILGRASKVCAACLKVHQRLTSPDISETQTVKCFAGLTYTSVPVKLYDRVIGFLQTGQVLLRNPSAKQFRKIATQLTNWGMKVNLAHLEDAYFRSRVVSPDQYHAIVRLLEIFAEYLSLIANQISPRQSNRGSAMVRRAKDYIADHKFETIRLEQIARALNVSTFHFCRKFKMETGVTFVDYLNRIRIERAKILLQNSSLRVSEIAYEVGFESLTHFNRTFRKLVCSSPTEHRLRVIEISEENMAGNNSCI